jgi:hypothetical protein
MIAVAESGTILSILHINQLSAFLQREVVPHLDLSRVRDHSEESTAALSQALATLGVQALTGFDVVAAAKSLIDDFDDNGIDAVAVDDDHERIVLVLAKWRRDGRRNIDQGESLKFANGARDLLAARFDRFNDRLLVMRQEIDDALLNPHVKILLAVVTTGPEELALHVRRPLDDLCEEINDTSELLEVRVLGLQAVHDYVVNGTSGAGVDLEVMLAGWGSVSTPYKAYYGIATAGQVAAWYEEHGERLFDGNLRDALGQTPVNEDLYSTLCKEPQHFWYFNNGITVLAQEVRRAARDSQTREYGRFQILGATVVNGAQTAASIRSVLRRDSSLLNDAMVWVRIISLDGCPEGFASRVTRATNTQNGVDARDFIALDPRQEWIRSQFWMVFGKTYGVRRGNESISGDSGCDVEEAAIALACALPDSDFAVNAKRQVSLLWAASDDPVYRELFPDNLNVARLWNSVQVLRLVEQEIAMLRRECQGRDAAVAVHGNRLIAHLVFSQIQERDLADPDAGPRGAFSAVSRLTSTMCAELTFQVQQSYPTAFLASLFKNHTKCHELVKQTLQAYTGTPVERSYTRPPTAPPAVHERRAGARKRDAVKVILEANGIADGTVLVFEPVTRREKEELMAWVNQDPKRGRATWINDIAEQLVWEADNEHYAPSRLVLRMMVMAGITRYPAGIRGPLRWKIEGQGTLSEIADKIIENSG